MKILFLFLAFNTVLFAQLTPNNNMYWNNISKFNPAIVGHEFNHSANINSSYSNFNQNNIFNSVFNYHGKIKKINSGFGVNIGLYKLNDYINLSDLTLNYAYHIKLKNEIDINIGAATNLSRAKISFYSPSIDPEYSINYNFGFVFKFKELLIGSSIQTGLNINDLFIEKPLIFNLHGSYEQAITENIKFKPGFYYGLQNEYNSFSLVGLLEYKEKINLGVLYELNSSIGAIVGYKLNNNLNFSYNLSHYQNAFSDNLELRHELSIGFYIP